MTRRTACLVLLTLLLLVGSAEAAPTLWSGYRIDDAPTADGGFMGARKTDGKVTYRIDADARRASGGYRGVRRVTGNRKVARAAWILSKYGDVRIADQAAAVDVATYALLSGKALKGPRATARLRDTGRAAAIRSLAKTMLVQSGRRAGPYEFEVVTVPGVVGGKVKVRVSVRSYVGRPVADLPVLLTLPDVAVRLETSAEGRIATSFLAEQVGLRKLKVVTDPVPDWRLSVRKPKHRGASRIALAGRKTKLVARTVVAVRAEPQVSVSTPTSAGETGRPLGATFTVTGSEGMAARQVVATLHGPFAAGATPTCSGAPVAQVGTTVTADGTYSTGTARVAAAGIYLWKVSLAESQLNAPTQACGGTVRVRTEPRIALDAERARLHFNVSRMPAGYDDEAVLKLFGPYPSRADATCKAGKKVGVVTKRVRGNGAYTSPRVATTRPGVYTWRLNLPAGYLSLRVATKCGAKGSFVTVSS